GDKLTEWSQTKLDTDIGRETGPLRASGEVAYERTERVNESRIRFAWRFDGRPNWIAEPAAQAVHPRISRWIWHEVRGEIWCDKGQGYHRVRLGGSWFPSHRLWVNGSLSQTIKQGPFSLLWLGQLYQPWYVAGVFGIAWPGKPGYRR